MHLLNFVSPYVLAYYVFATVCFSPHIATTKPPLYRRRFSKGPAKISDLHTSGKCHAL